MPAEDSSPSEQAPKYRSPKRTLARSFLLSRDRWKAKAGERREQLRALKVRLRDVEASRELWKQKALHLQEQLDQLLGLSSSLAQEDSSAASSPQPTLPAAGSAASDPLAEDPLAEPPPPLPEAPAAIPPPPSPDGASIGRDATSGTAPPAVTLPPPSRDAATDKKKTPPLTAADTTRTSVPGAHHDLDRIWLALSCILSGKVSLQSVPRLLEVFDGYYDLPGATTVPNWTTSRMWLMRLGLGQMRQPVVKADDWVLMLDHSIQLGRDRLLSVLGVRLCDLPPGPLQRSDLRPLHLQVMRDPNMHSNHTALLEVIERTGPPRAVLCDHGPDVLGAVRLLRESAASQGAILDLYDVKHRCAVELKYWLEPEPRWSEFLSQIGKTRNAAKQTEWAFLIPPVLRTKSRYLNLGELIRWASKTSWLVEHKPKALLEHGDPARLEEKLGWLLGFREDLKLWKQYYQVAARTEQVVRNRGLSRGIEVEVRQRLAKVTTEPTSKEMAAVMVTFVREQSKGLKEGERVPGSTQVLESCFGTLKALEKDHCRSGFTGLVLGLAALVGKVTKDVVRQALASTPIKAVRSWCERNISHSLQSKRGQAYRLARLAGVTDLG